MTLSELIAAVEQLDSDCDAEQGVVAKPFKREAFWAYVETRRHLREAHQALEDARRCLRYASGARNKEVSA